MGFSGGLDHKEFACNAGGQGFIPELGPNDRALYELGDTVQPLTFRCLVMTLVWSSGPSRGLQTPPGGMLCGGHYGTGQVLFNFNSAPHVSLAIPTASTFGGGLIGIVLCFSTRSCSQQQRHP